MEIKTCRGSGAGGQHRNTTDSAVQATHLPTGISVRIESERSQHANKTAALELLESRVTQQVLNQQKCEREKLRKNQVGSGMRGDKIRTIRQQDDTVTDHRTNKKIRYKDYIRGKWRGLV